MEEAGAAAPDFYVVGSKVTDEIRALEQPGNGIIIKGFVSEEELEQLYAECRTASAFGGWAKPPTNSRPSRFAKSS